MTNNQLLFDDLIVQVIRKPIKHMYVRINPSNAAVSVSIPSKASLDVVRLQLERKLAWINTRRAQLQSGSKPVDMEADKSLDAGYRQQMQRMLQELLQKWESIIPVRVSGLVIRTMTTRWGSCNTRTARICMNLNLVKKPVECMEYVLVHEMVHLLEASHNSRFYQLMNQYLPGWQVSHRLLNPNSRR